MTARAQVALSQAKEVGVCHHSELTSALWHSGEARGGQCSVIS